MLIVSLVHRRACPRLKWKMNSNASLRVHVIRSLTIESVFDRNPSGMPATPLDNEGRGHGEGAGTSHLSRSTASYIHPESPSYFMPTPDHHHHAPESMVAAHSQASSDQTFVWHGQSRGAAHAAGTSMNGQRVSESGEHNMFEHCCIRTSSCLLDEHRTQSKAPRDPVTASLNTADDVRNDGCCSCCTVM